MKIKTSLSSLILVLSLTLVILSCDEDSQTITSTPYISDESTTSDPAAGTDTPSGSSAFTDIYEPNNTLATSSTVGTNVRYEATIDPIGDNDWYSISLTKWCGGPCVTDYWIDITSIPSGTSYDIELYSSSGTLYISTSTGYIIPGFNSARIDTITEGKRIYLEMTDPFLLNTCNSAFCGGVSAAGSLNFKIKVIGSGTGNDIDSYFLHVW